jgi:hypothetical protein
MGHITNVTGLKKEEIYRYVITPMGGEKLQAEARDFWEPSGIWRITAGKLRKIKHPEKTVLYVLAHSGRSVSHIADSQGGTMTAQDLVDYLVGNELPPRILAVKIWACFTGVNGFAQEVKAKFLEKNMGYNPIVVGYNELTGGPGDIANDPHKHVFQEAPGGQKGPVIGRASANRTIY